MKKNLVILSFMTLAGVAINPAAPRTPGEFFDKVDREVGTGIGGALRDASLPAGDPNHTSLGDGLLAVAGTDIDRAAERIYDACKEESLVGQLRALIGILSWKSGADREDFKATRVASIIAYIAAHPEQADVSYKWTTQEPYGQYSTRPMQWERFPLEYAVALNSPQLVEALINAGSRMGKMSALGFVRTRYPKSAVDDQLEALLTR